jgi:hypothetical protein
MVTAYWNNTGQFVYISLVNLFQAALKQELRGVIDQQDQKLLTLSKVDDITTP